MEDKSGPPELPERIVWQREFEDFGTKIREQAILQQDCLLSLRTVYQVHGRRYGGHNHCCEKAADEQGRHWHQFSADIEIPIENFLAIANAVNSPPRTLGQANERVRDIQMALDNSKRRMYGARTFAGRGR